MGIIIGVLMIAIAILFLHEIILSIFGLMFGLLIASIAILLSFFTITLTLLAMVILGVLCLVGLVISILI